MTKFSILQLDPNCENYLGKLFSGIHFLEKCMNTKPNLRDYNVIYTSEIVDDNKSELMLCEDIFRIFNSNYPEDYLGHSLSISDIVAINGNYYYCDNFGFVKL